MKDATPRLPAPAGLADFAPVPRRRPRHDGWTPERQRHFIAALADTGCVAIAARMVNMTPESAYMLRRQPGAEDFRRAWEAAQGLGLQVVRDEAFDRAMNGQLVPVFVAGKLMGFRRKKNDRLLMFILRHYGQDAGGRKTTINYFSTRATAAAGAATDPPRDGEGDHPRIRSGDGGGGSKTHAALAQADPPAIALAKAEASTTTVRTVLTGPPAPGRVAAADEAAAILGAFDGVPLDEQAQAEIYRALEAAAERRRQAEANPANDRERVYISEREAGPYAGELEIGAERDCVEFRPEGEHLWEGLGEGGEAEKIDRVLADMEARKTLALSSGVAPVEGPKDPPREGEGDHGAERHGGGNPERFADLDGEGKEQPMSPHLCDGIASEEPAPAKAGRPRKPYKPRTPKPAFAPPDAAAEARSREEVEAERAKRRKPIDRRRRSAPSR